MIKTALQRNGGNRQRTAQELGIDPSTLYRKLKTLDIAIAKDGRSKQR